MRSLPEVLGELPNDVISFFATFLTHQWKAGLHSILLLIAYSDNYILFEAFRYFSVTQDVVPSFHYTLSFHITVVSLGTFLPFIDLISTYILSMGLNCRKGIYVEIIVNFHTKPFINTQEYKLELSDGFYN